MKIPPIGRQRLVRFLQDELLNQRLAVLSTGARRLRQPLRVREVVSRRDVDGLKYIDRVPRAYAKSRAPKLSTPAPLVLVGAQRDFLRITQIKLGIPAGSKDHRQGRFGKGKGHRVVMGS